VERHAVLAYDIDRLPVDDDEGVVMGWHNVRNLRNGLAPCAAQ
jgi:hypothetical protein